MVKIANINSFTVPNITYSLDYTKTTAATAQLVVDITTPSNWIRLNTFAMSFATAAVTNWVVLIMINNVPYIYPNINGTPANPYQSPPAGGVLTLNGNVPTDYDDLPPNTRIQIYAYNSGGASANSSMQLTMKGKAITDIAGEFEGS